MKINTIQVADDPVDWQSAGFTVTDDQVVIGKSFRIHLTGKQEGVQGITGWSLGIDGRQQNVECAPGGLPLIVTVPEQPPETVSHPNGIVNAMKAVVLCDNTTSALERMRAAVPDLVAPPIDGHDDKGIHYAIWPMADTEVGLEVVCLDPNQGNDAMLALFLVVEDLDASINRIGANDVTPVEIYGGRRMVRIKPRIGVTAGVCLIAAA